MKLTGRRRWLWGAVIFLFVGLACEWTSPTYPTPRPPLPTMLRATPVQSVTPQPTLSPTPLPTRTPTVAPAPQGLVYSVLPIRSEIPGKPLWIQTTADGTLWLVTDKAVLRLRPDLQWWLPYLQGYPGQVLGVDDRWRVWLWDEENQDLRNWDSNTWTRFDRDDGWLPVQGAVQKQLLQDGDGGLWLLTNGDVRRFDGQRWTVYTAADLGLAQPGAEEALTWQMAYWPERGELWLTSCIWSGPQPVRGGGVRFFDGQAWQKQAALDGACVVGMEVGGGRLWLAGVERVFALRVDGSSEEQRLQSGPAGVRPAYVLDFAFGEDGTAWGLVALCGGASCDSVRAAYQLQDGQWGAVGDVNPFLLRIVRNGRDDSIWLLGQDRLYRRPPEGGVFQPLPPLKMQMLTEDLRTGQVWILAEDAKEMGLWTLGKEE